MMHSSNFVVLKLVSTSSCFSKVYVSNLSLRFAERSWIPASPEFVRIRTSTSEPTIGIGVLKFVTPSLLNMQESEGKNHPLNLNRAWTVIILKPTFLDSEKIKTFLLDRNKRGR